MIAGLVDHPRIFGPLVRCVVADTDDSHVLGSLTRGAVQHVFAPEDGSSF